MTEGKGRGARGEKAGQRPAPTGGNARAGTGKKKGGQPGNNNARTHGLWAKNQPPVTREERDSNAGPEKRRDIMDRVIKRLWEDFCEAEEAETRCRIANALCVAVTAANGCDRTLAIVTGKISPLQQAIDGYWQRRIQMTYSTIEHGTQKGDQG